MEPLAAYLQQICIRNQAKQTFDIDVAKVVADLSSSCIVIGHGHIIRIVKTVINRPHVTSVNKDGSKITVEITCM